MSEQKVRKLKVGGRNVDSDDDAGDTNEPRVMTRKASAKKSTPASSSGNASPTAAEPPAAAEPAAPAPKPVEKESKPYVAFAEPEVEAEPEPVAAAIHRDPITEAGVEYSNNAQARASGARPTKLRPGCPRDASPFGSNGEDQVEEVEGEGPPVALESGTENVLHPQPQADVELQTVQGFDDGTGNIRTLNEPEISKKLMGDLIPRGAADARRRRSTGRKMSRYDRFLLNVTLIIDKIEKVFVSIEEEETIAWEVIEGLHRAAIAANAKWYDAYLAKKRKEEAEEEARIKREQEAERRRQEEIRKQEAEKRRRQEREAKRKAEEERKRKREEERKRREEARKKKEHEEEERRLKEEAERAARLAEVVESKKAQEDRRKAEEALAAAKAKAHPREGLYKWSDDKLQALDAPEDLKASDDRKPKDVDAPDVPGTKKKLFDRVPIYSIIHKTSANEEWSFFNGSTDYEFHPKYIFGGSSKITAQGSAVLKTNATRGLEVTDVVYPGETKKFIIGHPNGYSANFSAKALSSEYKELIAKQRADVINKEISAVKKLRFKLTAKVEETRKALNEAGEVVDNLAEELLLQECLKTKTPYVDLTFLPQQSSISPDDDTAKPFARPEWFLPKETPPQLFMGSIEPDDINQGRLGDCWFLCAVAALSEFPEKIVDAFDHPDVDNSEDVRTKKSKIEERTVGAYRVCINKNGWWSNHIVDSFVPAVRKPLFAHNETEPNEMWVAILEKAFAKAHGNYQKIVAGDPMKALHDLTGFPCFRLDDLMSDDGERDTLHDKLCVYDQHDYLMTISTPGSESNPTVKHTDAGLVTGHAYSLLSAKRFDDKGSSIRIVQIRNPWGGSKEWNGDWSDKSKKWDEHPNIKKKLNFTPADDGTFWMSWEDACEYFDGCGVCFLQHGWYDHRIKGMFTMGSTNIALEVTVKKPVDVFLTLSQTCTRADPEYEAKAMILVLANTNNGTSYTPMLYSAMDPEEPATKPVFKYNRDQAMRLRLQPTTDNRPYLIFPREYTRKATCPFTMGILSDQPSTEETFEVKFRQVNITRDSKFAYHPAMADHVTAEYQLNDDASVPLSYRGDSIRFTPTA